MKRVFLIVLDSFGIGAAPDAALFGDTDANTLRSIARSPRFNATTLVSLGLGNVEGVSCLPRVAAPRAAFGRLRELSAGKDTTIGHWELSGLISPRPLPTYPDGFPDELIAAFERETGRGTLCNKPYSGTDVIRDFGEEHLRSGKLIVYTSADSVFQIAAHEDVVPPSLLYEYCRTARKLLSGENAVGRVIARPFVGGGGRFTRTANRRDFSLEPHGATVLDALREAGLDSIGVGKISDIFATRGIGESYPTHGNREGMERADALLGRDFHGLAFINLVDFDMLYGHRQDPDGYAGAIAEFDAWLAGFVERLGHDDLLLITADHGCDPSDESTDHTREYVPLLAFGEGIVPRDLGTLSGFTNVARLVADALGVDYAPTGALPLFERLTLRKEEKRFDGAK